VDEILCITPHIDCSADQSCLGCRMMLESPHRDVEGSFSKLWGRRPDVAEHTMLVGIWNNFLCVKGPLEHYGPSANSLRTRAASTVLPAQIRLKETAGRVRDSRMAFVGNLQGL
jgi:hypothetical protein